MLLVLFIQCSIDKRKKVKYTKRVNKEKGEKIMLSVAVMENTK